MNDKGAALGGLSEIWAADKEQQAEIVLRLIDVTAPFLAVREVFEWAGWLKLAARSVAPAPFFKISQFCEGSPPKVLKPNFS